MKSDHNELRLRPGVALLRDANGVGLQKAGQTRYAKNGQQAAMLQQIGQNRLALDAMVAAANAACPGGLQSGMAALAVAEFILDFEEYLEK